MTFEVSVYPIFDAGDGGLTANKGPLCAHTESDRLSAAMEAAGVQIEKWSAADPDDAGFDPIAFDVRVVVN